MSPYEEQILQFCKEHKELLKDNNFTLIYEILGGIEGLKMFSGIFTSMMLDNGINPLKYMKKIPTWYISNGTMTEVDIPPNITQIDYNALAHNDSVKSLFIPDTVQSIANEAVMFCSRLTSIAIEHGSKLSLYGCPFTDSPVRQVYLPSTLQSVGVNFLYSDSPQVYIHCEKGSGVEAAIKSSNNNWHIINDYH